jgi:hypothetical protein
MQVTLLKLRNSKRALQNWLNMRLRLTIFLVFLFPSLVRGQVNFTSPLPDGILQVHGDHADLRLHVLLQGHSSFSYKLSSSVDTSSISEGWVSVSVKHGVVDTLLTVPKLLRGYGLYWRTGQSTTDTFGEIGNLTPGHIIGIAGQSNAVGYVWPPYPIFVAVPQGDFRMLTNDSSWQPAAEPTAGSPFGQGPWIEMANELYAQIDDTLPIGIVNTAVGGTGLTVSVGSGRWLKNSPNASDTMYPNAIDRFLHAGSELECFTWIQGEADGEGGALFDPKVYRTQFDTLMHNVWSDLQDTFPIFHLQISGYSGQTGSPGTYPEAREALRVLPPSTLVGTAAGRSLWDSAFHYSVTTYRSVGQMFAGAVLKNKYGISYPMYPPLMPDTVALLDSITDGSIKGKYCFSIGFTRGGIPAKVSIVSPYQYFWINKDGLPLFNNEDTTEVWFRISPTNSSRVQIGFRNDSITPMSNYWSITYDAIANGEFAPLATIDPITGDTIFATTFFELPVQLPTGPPASVREFDVQTVDPNPTSDAIQCYVFSFKHQTMTIEVVNDLGVSLRQQSAVVDEGEQIVTVSTDGLLSGNYWIVLRDENGNESVQKAAVIR